ncbi:hypothetical protein [Leucobacter aridicollis]|uniref:hypothetical protein n=1 Tax=Leucobacter aridicollis TaxID=283878 RepID=UPI0021041D18|nr:hypothetical protein [Leucobacter aridicollis]UTX53180.1 hypothetical protein KI794_16105 [Leucobacter aridicollis]
MSIAEGTVSRPSGTALLPPKWVRVLRAVLLLTVGLVVTFSATFHERFAFDLAVVVAALVAIGIVHIVEALQRRARGGGAIAVALGTISVAAAVFLTVLSTELAFAVVIAAWALVTALLEFVAMVVQPGTRQDAALIGAAGILLAVTVLLARGDLVAVIGFFGAYAIIAGVFLGIASFDTRTAADADPLNQGSTVNA